ncbi:cathepsin B-like isoform X1 [Tenebrio molitor]|uniref:cathepsin B-like isoform X1 n=2 Tax=Tenebrio molitor TaxID=7067 RepID=UPI00362481B3
MFCFRNYMIHLLFLFVLFALPISITAELEDEFIQAINKRKLTWTARHNFAKNVSKDDLKKLVGTRSDFYTSDENPVLTHRVNMSSIPKYFDSRNHWHWCRDVISHVRSQGFCSIAWATAPASAMSDRTCIESGGRVKKSYSAEDIMTCCLECKIDLNPCHGGWHHKAWNFWVKKGVASGGDYGSKEGCKPNSEVAYHHGPPTCEHKCSNDHYQIPYDEDKEYGRFTYKLSEDERQIRAEILSHGAVTSVMDVYEDFFSYEGGVSVLDQNGKCLILSAGVYQHFYGKYVGTHVVKIFGWGEEQGEKYWLAANSWGPSWGNSNGTFKITRGAQECEIEREVRGGRTLGKLSPREYLWKSPNSAKPKQNLQAIYFLLPFLLHLVNS